MQIVIDIPNWLYNAIMDCKEPQYSKSLGDAVRDGTPLPKGHGRLIDVDEVKKRLPIMENDFGMVINKSLHNELDKVPTVEAISKANMMDILNKIKVEIEKQEKWLLQVGYNSYNVDIAFSTIKSLLNESEV